jgi:hypothetical protein
VGRERGKVGNGVGRMGMSRREEGVVEGGDVRKEGKEEKCEVS